MKRAGTGQGGTVDKRAGSGKGRNGNGERIGRQAGEVGVGKGGENRQE